MAEVREPLTRRSVLLGGISGLAGLTLTACAQRGGARAEASAAGTGPAVSPSTPPADGAQEVTLVVSDDFVFAPERFSVVPGRVRLRVESRATQMTHNFRFSPGGGPVDIAASIPILAPGDSGTVEFDVDQPGDYQYECSFHVAVGQIGTMTVT